MTTIFEDWDDTIANDSDHEERLSSAICQRLVEDFVERTQINEAPARAEATGGIDVQEKILTG